eukprot:1811951-Rhodomonas_salina.2
MKSIARPRAHAASLESPSPHLSCASHSPLRLRLAVTSRASSWKPSMESAPRPHKNAGGREGGREGEGRRRGITEARPGQKASQHLAMRPENAGTEFVLVFALAGPSFRRPVHGAYCYKVEAVLSLIDRGVSGIDTETDSATPPPPHPTPSALPSASPSSVTATCPASPHPMSVPDPQP